MLLTELLSAASTKSSLRRLHGSFWSRAAAAAVPILGSTHQSFHMQMQKHIISYHFYCIILYYIILYLYCYIMLYI